MYDDLFAGKMCGPENWDCLNDSFRPKGWGDLLIRDDTLQLCQTQ